MKPAREDFDAFLDSLELYYGDATIWEPKLLQLYDDVLPKIDQALR
jgi:hypothetical protein